MQISYEPGIDESYKKSLRDAQARAAFILARRFEMGSPGLPQSYGHAEMYYQKALEFDPTLFGLARSYEKDLSEVPRDLQRTQNRLSPKAEVASRDRSHRIDVTQSELVPMRSQLDAKVATGSPKEPLVRIVRQHELSRDINREIRLADAARDERTLTKDEKQHFRRGIYGPAMLKATACEEGPKILDPRSLRTLASRAKQPIDPLSRASVDHALAAYSDDPEDYYNSGLILKEGQHVR